MTVSSFTLVSHHLCPYVQRAAITLAEKEIAHERVYIDLANKPAWFTDISPMGRVPLLRVGDSVLFESAVICEFLDEVTPGSLHPGDPLRKAEHRAWVEFGSTVLNDIGGLYNAPDAENFERKRQRLVDRFRWLEKHLDDGPYFAGERFHLVDAVYGPVFRYFDVFERIGDFGFFAATSRVRAYRQALSRRPSVRAAVARDYPDRLMDFLRRRDSHLSSLIPATASEAPTPALESPRPRSPNAYEVRAESDSRPNLR